MLQDQIFELLLNTGRTFTAKKTQKPRLLLIWALIGQLQNLFAFR